MKQFLLIIIVIFAISCEPVYKAENTAQIVKQHRTIAILPTRALIEIKNTGEADKIKPRKSLKGKSYNPVYMTGFRKESR